MDAVAASRQQLADPGVAWQPAGRSIAPTQWRIAAATLGATSMSLIGHFSDLRGQANVVRSRGQNGPGCRGV